MDDFAMYMGDIAAGQVQYGTRTEMCSYLIQNGEKKPSEFFPELMAQQKAAGNDPVDYDTRPGMPITTQIIDPFNAGRPWTY